jgi:hypothetical protein
MKDIKFIYLQLFPIAIGFQSRDTLALGGQLQKETQLSDRVKYSLYMY